MRRAASKLKTNNSHQRVGDRGNGAECTLLCLRLLPPWCATGKRGGIEGERVFGEAGNEGWLVFGGGSRDRMVDHKRRPVTYSSGSNQVGSVHTFPNHDATCGVSCVERFAYLADTKTARPMTRGPGKRRQRLECGMVTTIVRNFTCRRSAITKRP